MKGNFTFLGTGGSAGVPMIGCRCLVCTSSSHFNKRLRSAGLLEVNGTRLLIDVGPEFRLQALKHEIDELDAVLLTHAHSDHIAGLDDLRAYFYIHHQKIPCYLSKETFDEVALRYHYMLKPLQSGKSTSAQIDFSILEHSSGEFSVKDLPIHYFSYYQVEMKVTGYRIGNFAYVSDIREYGPEVLKALKGVDVLVLSALRHVPTAMHFSVEEAIAFSKSVGAKMTYLTHISHELEYAATNALLPEDVRMSYDGLNISVEL